MPIPIVIAILAVVAYYTVKGVMVLRKDRPRPASLAGDIKAEKKPEDKKNIKKGFNLAWVIGIAVAASLLTWGFTSSYGGRLTTPPATSSRAVVIKPKEEWLFSQVNKNGEKPIFEVEITKRDAGLLYAIIQRDEGGRKVNIAGLRLNELGDRLTGTWANYLCDDHGECTMYRVTDQIWSGHYQLQDKTTRLCTLERK